MHSQRRKTSRALTIPLLVAFAIIAAASPAAASTTFANLDGGALAMIIGFGTLLFAIVFEVWRLTLRQHTPARNRATQEWKPRERD